MQTPVTRKLLLSAMCMLVPLSAYAEPVSDAKRVIQHRLAMVNPTSVFNQWQADQWTFAAIECGRSVGLKREMEAIKKLPLHLNGTHGLPSNLASFCETLAVSGPAAECFNISTMQPPFTGPTAGLPSNYLFLKSASAAKDGTQKMVGGYCHLVKNAPHTRQFFAGKATLKWLTEPRAQQFQTPSGPRMLNAGTIAFIVAGMPGPVSPKTVIIGQ